MNVTLGGKFESALVRNIDAVIHPDRNTSTHPYYIDLNRNVSSDAFYRCGTFVAISDSVIVPPIDWGYPYSEEARGELGGMDLGINLSPDGHEGYGDLVMFAELLIKRSILSKASFGYMTALDLSHYPTDARRIVERYLHKNANEIAKAYLTRLFLQCQCGRAAGYLVLSEPDLMILQELGEYISDTGLPTPIDIPDVQSVMLGSEPLCGMLNFAPPDIHAVAAVRADSVVRSYAEKVRHAINCNDRHRAETEALEAMASAYRNSSMCNQVETIFEVQRWILKPLSYVPVVGTVMSAYVDLLDVLEKWVRRRRSGNEWYLLAPRMQDIAVKDYLRRKANLISAPFN